MPWHVEKSDSCPPSKPYAVVKDADGSAEGCHATREAARRQLAALYAQEGKTVKTLTLEAKATVTDLGEFTAIAAAYTTDRVNDRIIPGAFTATIARWRASGKMIPVHWDHSGAPEDIIGTADPELMEETGDGLQVKGRLDLDTPVGREAWRLMKANAVGLSFGYLTQESSQGEDGTTELRKLDLFEVSITPAPANPDTRFIELKARETVREEIAAIRERLDEMEKKLAPETAEEVTGSPQDVTDEEPEEGPTPEASVGHDTQTAAEVAEWDRVLLEAQGAN